MKNDEFNLWAKNWNEFDLIGPNLSSEQKTLLRSRSLPKLYVDQEKSLGEGIALGDQDSCSFVDILKSNQDQSDLAFTLGLLPQEIKALHLFGFLGGRRDHELANLGEAEQFLGGRSLCQILFDEGELSALSKGEWSNRWSGNLSLMTLFSQRISVQGEVSYEVQDFDLNPLSSQGLSNQSEGAFSILCEKPLFIYRTSSQRIEKALFEEVHS